jgi:hypothetical protein
MYSKAPKKELRGGNIYIKLSKPEGEKIFEGGGAGRKTKRPVVDCVAVCKAK